jgi:hypothetical protein
LIVAGEFGQVDIMQSTFNRLLWAPDCIVVERHQPSEPGLARDLFGPRPNLRGWVLRKCW